MRRRILARATLPLGVLLALALTSQGERTEAEKEHQILVEIPAADLDRDAAPDETPRAHP